jgi:hypothetical protein
MRFMYAYACVTLAAFAAAAPRAPVVTSVHRRRRTNDTWAEERARPPRNGTRALATPEVPVVLGSGTHFAYLWIGTPPQRQSVILDTGSYYMGFPCTPCAQCGNYLAHRESGPFEPAQSATFQDTRKPPWSAAYAEGDGWQANVVSDEVRWTN